MVEIDGTPGVEGCILITTLAEGCEMHPPALVTVKLYVFAARPVTVSTCSCSGCSYVPGFLVRVHVPEEGNPLRVTLPVAISQVGWILVPDNRCSGEGGTALITTLPVAWRNTS